MQPAAAGFLGLLVGGIFLLVAFTRAARGLDGVYSIANIQLILWTSAIMGSYVAMAALKGDFLDQIPANTIMLMGISGASTSMATIIRSTQESDNKAKSGAGGAKAAGPGGAAVAGPGGAGAAGPGGSGTGGAFNSESKPEKNSIAKIQMFAWSLVALGIFISLAAGNIAKGEAVLPDVDQAIMSLMGIGHGVYLANKTQDKPR